MKKILISIVALCLTSTALAQTTATSMTKPGLRWWWLGSAVTPEGLTYNMEQMASHGIGTLEITPLYGVQGNDRNNIDFLTPKWMDMLKHCINEGNRLGVQIDMNLGTGWPFGGPTTPISEAACKLVVVDSIVDMKPATVMKGRKGKKASILTFNDTLPAPAKEKQYAKLILQKVYPKADGKARVIALYESRTRQKVKRAAPGGEGFVIDHYDSTAVAHYLQKFDNAFSQAGMWQLNTQPATFFNDSYEVYQADWTPTLMDEFKARRGYALEDHVEEFVDGNAQIISDYRETLADLLLHNFTEQWVAWSHQHGIMVRNQAHGSPANLIDLYSAVDIPEIEGFGLSDFGIKGLRRDPGFTKKNFSDLSMLKYASSAAHITGKKYTSSETFTWLTEHFRTSLSQMKPDLDLMFCSGVNRVFFHGACYSPKDDPWPGWRFYASVDMSPTNTIWRDAPELTNYIDFCQQRLQSGQPDNDFLVLLPIRNMWLKNTKSRYMMFDIHSMEKKAPEFISTILKIDSLGFDCDYTSEKYLLTTQYVNGKLQTAAGTRYAALIIPGNDCILSPAVQQHVETLKAQGATVIYKVEQNSLTKSAQPEQIRTDLHLKMIRRIVDGKYQYFVSNLTPGDIHRSVKLASTGQSAMIDLRSGESVFLYTSSENPSVDAVYPIANAHANETATEIADLTNNKWTLRFSESQPVIDGIFTLNALQPWENGISSAPSNVNDSIRTLMGTGIYETTFKLSSKQLTKTNHASTATHVIALGDVRESARVYINEQYVGTSWSVPYTLNIPANVLKKGKNTLRIEVTNLPANRIAEYDRRGIKWRKFNEINVVDLNYKKTTYDQWAPVPSGLNSSVKIYLQ